MGGGSILVTLLAASATAAAQTGQDARPLLESIANEVRSAGSLRVDGVSTEESTSPAQPMHKETRFELTLQGPFLMRYEAEQGTNRTLQICDGTSRWEYRQAAASYIRDTEDEALCTPPVPVGRGIAENLISATVTGRDHAQFEGRLHACEVIAAVYRTIKPPMAAFPAAGDLSRVLCVDPDRRLILRERIEYSPGPANYSMTIACSRVEYNSPQPPEYFQFHPPAGSWQAGVNLPLTGEGGPYSGPPPIAGASFPRPISRVEAQYSPTALKAKLQGEVLVSLVVDEDGIPRNMKVVRALGLGLDEKAIEAVAQWRFRPAVRNGNRVAVPTQVEVRFRVP